MVSPAEAVININLKEQTEALLKTLTPREEKVIKMRFGLGDGSEHTLEEVGQNFAVTRERIRQIEAKALRKLRHPSPQPQAEGVPGGQPDLARVASEPDAGLQKRLRQLAGGSMTGGPSACSGGAPSVGQMLIVVEIQ